MAEVDYDFINVAPAPLLSRLDGTHQRVAGIVKMFGRMFILGIITTSNITANQTQPQMHPSISHVETFLTDAGRRLENFNLIQMRAFIFHKKLRQVDITALIQSLTIICPPKGNVAL